MTSPALHTPEPTPAPLPRALPAWAYSHPEMTRLEFERILRPSWQIICHVNSIPRPGDYLTFDFGPESLVAIRSPQGEVQVFHNVCRHRGARILEGTGHCPGTITCPYHGWSYRLTGELIGMPVRESFPGLERAQHALKPVRTTILFGFVFACLAGEPPPLESSWGHFLEDFAPHRFESLEPLGPLYLEHWDVDWKIAMDNYLESYHVPIGHPGLFRMFTPDYDDQANLPGIARGISWMRERPSSKWSERMYQQLIGQVTTDLPEAHRRRWSFYSMLPNLGIDVFPDQMDFFQVLPRGPGKCTIRGGSFARPDARREMKVVRYLAMRINRQVQREDEFLCRRVQRGLASSSYEPGPLSQLESCMLEFHDLLRERIPEVRLASPPPRFA
ncbi:MAG TPA: aromatic ring-hydroxylating dioxygenase subunit alpha [Steroidobacteraceae bacterium]|jgi:phenylpropionate dioxygenase-like ring-hydroxylating dioxygenase large terminal subunit